MEIHLAIPYRVRPIIPKHTGSATEKAITVPKGIVDTEEPIVIIVADEL